MREITGSAEQRGTDLLQAVRGREPFRRPLRYRGATLLVFAEADPLGRDRLNLTLSPQDDEPATADVLMRPLAGPSVSIETIEVYIMHKPNPILSAGDFSRALMLVASHIRLTMHACTPSSTQHKWMPCWFRIVWDVCNFLQRGLRAVPCASQQLAARGILSRTASCAGQR